MIWFMKSQYVINWFYRKYDYTCMWDLLVLKLIFGIKYLIRKYYACLTWFWKWKENATPPGYNIRIKRTRQVTLRGSGPRPTGPETGPIMVQASQKFVLTALAGLRALTQDNPGQKRNWLKNVPGFGCEPVPNDWNKHMHKRLFYWYWLFIVFELYNCIYICFRTAMCWIFTTEWRLIYLANVFPATQE